MYPRTDKYGREVVLENNAELETAAYAIDTMGLGSTVEIGFIKKEEIDVAALLRKQIDPENDQPYSFHGAFEQLAIGSLTKLSHVTREQQRQLGIPDFHRDRAQDMILSYLEDGWPLIERRRLAT